MPVIHPNWLDPAWWAGLPRHYDRLHRGRAG